MHKRSSIPTIETDRDAFRLGVKEAAGIPALVMGASFIGYGSMVNDVGWTFWQGTATTVLMWALPGQITLVEMFVSGAPLLAITISVAIINARLLPMVASLLPQVRRPGVPPWGYYVVANIIAVTSWVGCMLRAPDLEPERRFSYLLGYGGFLWVMSPIAGAIGYLASGLMAQPVIVALVFLNPLYFMLVFLLDVKKPGKLIALLLGAVMGPVLFLLTPDWSLLMTGLVGGSAAYFLGRSIEHKKGGGT